MVPPPPRPPWLPRAPERDRERAGPAAPALPPPQVQGLSLRAAYDPASCRLVVDVPQTETLLAELCIKF